MTTERVGQPAARPLHELLAELEVFELSGNAAVAVKGLACDSRRVQPGDLFVALRGFRVDGHRFVDQAIERGAAAVVVEEYRESFPEVTRVVVPDTRKALARLASAFFGYPGCSLHLIGVTGTNGKTTTTLLLESILREAGHRVGVLGTLAYRWGAEVRKAAMTTPESLEIQKYLAAMRDDGMTHVVMEVSSHALALSRVEGCPFRVGVFTNLSQDHLDFHENMEAYFQAKTCLFTRCPARAPAPPVAVINVDDPYGRRLAGMVPGPPVTFSIEDPGAEIHAENVTLSASGIHMTVRTPVGRLDLRSALLGRLNASNILAAVGAGVALGTPTDALVRGIEGVRGVDGRLQRLATAGGFDVVVDYAHTPDAMEKALACLRELTGGRLWAVFGCGGDRDRIKRPLMGRVAARLADLVVLTSDNPRSEDPAAILREIEPGVEAEGLSRFEPRDLPVSDRGYTVIADRREAIEYVLSRALAGDLVFVGGKGHETYQIVGDMILDFDDRRVVAEFFRPARAAADD